MPNDSLTDAINTMQTDTEVVEPINQGDLQEAPESAKPGADAPKPPEGTPQTQPKFKYKDQTEAERAYQEAVRKMTEATERASRYEKMLERLSQNQPRPVEQEAPAKRIAKEALQQIKQLSPEDPNYEEKAAIIWAEAQEKIADAKYTEQNTRNMNQQQMTTYAESKAKEAGLTSPMMLEAFWTVARNAPSGIPFDDQVQWSINQVNQFIESIRQEATAQTTEQQVVKKDLKVLSKGGKGPGAPKDDEAEMPSLGAAIKAARKKVTS